VKHASAFGSHESAATAYLQLVVAHAGRVRRQLNALPGALRATDLPDIRETAQLDGAVRFHTANEIEMRFTPAEWRAFVAVVGIGEFD
jgi:hypothetical protein